MQTLQLVFTCGHTQTVNGTNAGASSLVGKFKYCAQCKGMRVVNQVLKSNAPMSAVKKGS